MGGTARPWQKVKSIRRRRRARAPSPLRNDQSDHSDQSDQSEQSPHPRRASPGMPSGRPRAPDTLGLRSPLSRPRRALITRASTRRQRHHARRPFLLSWQARLGAPRAGAGPARCAQHAAAGCRRPGRAAVGTLPERHPRLGPSPHLRPPRRSGRALAAPVPSARRRGPPLRLRSCRASVASGSPASASRAQAIGSRCARLGPPRPPGLAIPGVSGGRLAHHGPQPSAPRRARLGLSSSASSPRPPGRRRRVSSPITGLRHRLPAWPASGSPPPASSPRPPGRLRQVAPPITGLSHRLPAVPDSGSPPRPPRLALPGVAGASPRPSRACAIGFPPCPTRALLLGLLASPSRAPSAPRLARLGLPSLGPSPRPSGRHRLPAAPASSGLAASPATGLLTGGSPPCPPRAGHRLPASSVTGTRNTQGPMQLPRRQDRCDTYGRRGSTSLPLAGPL